MRSWLSGYLLCDDVGLDVDGLSGSQRDRKPDRQIDRLGGGNRELLLVEVEEAATGAYYPHSFIHSTRLFGLMA